MPYISIWCYNNGHCWRTVAYSLQKASHDMVNTWNDHNLQITPLYNTHRNTTKKNSQQHNCFWAFRESFFTWLRKWRKCIRRAFAQYILITPMCYVCTFRPEYQKNKESIPCISLWFHIWKLFSICDVTATSKFSQYLSHSWPHSGSLPRYYASAYLLNCNVDNNLVNCLL